MTVKTKSTKVLRFLVCSYVTVGDRQHSAHLILRETIQDSITINARKEIFLQSALSAFDHLTPIEQI